MIERRALGGTDGVRGPFMMEGPIGEMTPTTVALLSAAHTEQLKEQTDNDSPQVVIGSDTRKFNAILINAAVWGVRARGGTPMVHGVMPTPELQWQTLDIGADGTQALTSSHNPARDAGWKAMYGAEKPHGDEVKAIDDTFWGFAEDGLGDAFEPKSMQVFEDHSYRTDKYIAAVVEDIQQHFGERPLEGKMVVVDTARGAARLVTPKVLELLGATVERFACDLDGDINDGCGATHLEGVEQFVREIPELAGNKKLVGIIGNDGDADRVMGVGALLNHGVPEFRRLDGNIALELMAEGQPGVVGTVYTNDASVKRIEQAGGGFEFCPNGDVNVTYALRKKEWTRGAEFSGHIVDHGWGVTDENGLRKPMPSGDGVRMGAWLLAYAAVNGTNFAEIVQQKPLFPELMKSIRLPRGTVFKTQWIEEVLAQSSEDKAHGFRHVTRASGTEPLVRVWGVGADQYYVNWRVEGIARAVRNAVIG